MSYKARPDDKLFLVSDFEGVCNPDKQRFEALGMITKWMDVVLIIRSQRIRIYALLGGKRLLELDGNEKYI